MQVQRTLVSKRLLLRHQEAHEAKRVELVVWTAITFVIVVIVIGLISTGDLNAYGY